MTERKVNYHSTEDSKDVSPLIASGCLFICEDLGRCAGTLGKEVLFFLSQCSVSYNLFRVLHASAKEITLF